MIISETIQTSLIDALRAAAKSEILPRFRRLDPSMIETKSGPFDLVTEADIAAEAVLAQHVATLMPEALFVGEESVSADAALLDRFAAAELSVVVDPVDGTGNFASDLAVFGMILAVVHKGDTVFGVLYDPIMDDWIYGVRGQGAWFQRPGETRVRLTGPSRREVGHMTGYVPLNLFPSWQQVDLMQRLGRFGRVHNLRCSCHEYRMLALGHVDYLVTATGNPWDHAAGCLIVEECGGVVAADGVPGYRPTKYARHLAVLGQADNAVHVSDIYIPQDQAGTRA